MKDMNQSMQISKVAQSFRRGLKTYHESATQQANIAQHLSDLMAQHLPPQLGRALEFGMGTGHLTRAVSKYFQIDRLYLNDLVSDCADFAPKGAAFVGGPIEGVAMPQNLDLICSASTVQWVEDLPSMLERLTDALAPGGWLALSGFGHKQFQELRTLGSTAMAPNYMDASEWQLVLPENLRVQHTSQAQTTEWFPSALSLLKHLRDTGVNGASNRSWTTQDLRAFEAEYTERFGTKEGLPLTYDPVWVLVQKV